MLVTDDESDREESENEEIEGDIQCSQERRRNSENLLQLQLVNRNHQCQAIANSPWCQICNGRCNPLQCRCINETLFNRETALENVIVSIKCCFPIEIM